MFLIFQLFQSLYMILCTCIYDRLIIAYGAMCRGDLKVNHDACIYPNP